MAATKKRASRAGGAFGALNNLSETGALAAINATPPQPVPTTVDAEPAPAHVSHNDAADIDADGGLAAGVTAEPTAQAAAEELPQPATVPAQAPERIPMEPAQDAKAPDTPVIVSVPEGESKAAGRVSQAARIVLDPQLVPAPDVPPAVQRPAAVEAAAPEPSRAPSPAEAIGLPAAGLAATGLAAAPAEARPAVKSSLESTSGYMQPRHVESLPPLLAQKVHGLPRAYMLLATSYRAAKSARPGRSSRTKRNMRLHIEVSDTLTRQLLADKRLLGIKDLKPSHYVDAALTYARSAEVGYLIEEADRFRDQHLGEENSLDAPNHYSIAGENDLWLNDMIDEMLVARATGLHGHMINMVIEAFLKELASSPTT